MRRWVAAISLLLAGFVFASPVHADTLERVKEKGVFRIGYRADARPHSFQDAGGRPTGYIVDLCREVASTVKRAVGNEQLQIEYVVVTASNRFEQVTKGDIDILCEASSVSIARRQIVDFSIPTFVDGAAMLSRNGTEYPSFESLAGKRVGVLTNTTSAELLRSSLEQLGIKATVVPMNDHGEGAGSLSAGKIDVYFGDRSILASLLFRKDVPEGLQLGKRYFSYETYGLAFAPGDYKFRLLVDRTLARLYRTGAAEAAIQRAFGAPPDELLKIMVAINGIPD
ncbi:glutamate/aspartate periplasmic-binding protein precursor [Variibacter gotjawalensis]|uniref:Glutamate/aspartate periplasmic-binding protein n=1 Tax=Variibacter gotjawalensis TaxID=1333996 RepID=A0A0S3PXR1_9BRAD|nr:amino acid ABC transporter substrate-binding protein [Variibacter gotjawalensis]NIK46544.1 ABC-type amino acid transport substrate-binding protein [Variibacter gotjawalensis]RZS48449.1 amino acid ABC transporter substrate-binding protein (PAAT family) [Variibacter gotjawalensis]BAT60710.1 glutamate/aspartate periplasmic-binding protein precursor [Variibacter gotjawalensis]